MTSEFEPCTTEWEDLGLSASVLNLEASLFSGQSFRWVRQQHEYLSVLGNYAVALRYNESGDRVLFRCLNTSMPSDLTSEAPQDQVATPSQHVRSPNLQPYDNSPPKHLDHPTSQHMKNLTAPKFDNPTPSDQRHAPLIPHAHKSTSRYFDSTKPIEALTPSPSVDKPTLPKVSENLEQCHLLDPSTPPQSNELKSCLKSDARIECPGDISEFMHRSDFQSEHCDTIAERLTKLSDDSIPSASSCDPLHLHGLETKIEPDFEKLATKSRKRFGGNDLFSNVPFANFGRSRVTEPQTFLEASNIKLVLNPEVEAEAYSETKPKVNHLSMEREDIDKKYAAKMELSSSENTLQYKQASQTKSDEGFVPSVNDLRRKLLDFFNSSVDLQTLTYDWRKTDANFWIRSQGLEGLRTLRVDPLESLISFICSSNNNIPRISQMVERLCAMFPENALNCNAPWTMFRFPTIPQLSQVSEAALRSAGFGFRAPFIVSAVRQLDQLGGEAWLETLARKEVSAREASGALQRLRGVGAKVADCVCLCSLGKHAAIPVDTHCWQLARRDYLPTLASAASLTAKRYQTIGDFFRGRFGDYAGWAFMFLFAAELAPFKKALRAKKRKASSGEGSTSKFFRDKANHSSMRTDAFSQWKRRKLTAKEWLLKIDDVR